MMKWKMGSCTKQAVLEDEGTCSDNEIYDNGSLNNENVENGTETLDDSVPSNIVNLRYKFERVHWRQETLCNYKGPKLQNAMKRHLYQMKYGEEARNSAHELVQN